MIAVLAAAAAALLLKLRANRSGGKTAIQLRGTLVVTYYRSANAYTWEKYVMPGRYYTRRSPAASLGKMLRDLGDPEEIPADFDGLFIGGVMDPDRQQYVEISGNVGSGEYTQPVHTRLRSETGMGPESEFDSFEFEDANKVSLALPDGGMVEFSFMLG